MLALALVCLGAASAEDGKVAVRYVDYAGRDKGEKDCTVVVGGNEHKILGAGWYVVREDVSFSEGMIITGNVDLILAGGCTLHHSHRRRRIDPVGRR